MTEKKKVEFIFRDEDEENEERLCLYGRSIGFGRIIDKLIEFRGMYMSYYEKESNIREINQYRAREEGGFICSDNASNRIRNYISTGSLVYVERKSIGNSINKFLKRNSDKVAGDISRDIEIRYPIKEWRELVPLSGLLDILFNKYKDCLKS